MPTAMSPSDLTDADRTALILIDRDFASRRFTCTELGERLFEGHAGCHRQALARPAGRVLARLKSRGLVRDTFDPESGRRVWCRLPI